MQFPGGFSTGLPQGIPCLTNGARTGYASKMRLATWNVNSLRVRLPHLLDWLQQQPVDVIGLQETKLVDEAFPFDELKAAGFDAVHNGQKTYNGVALLSRLPMEDVSRDLPGFDCEQKRVIAATIGGIRVVNVYVVNGQALGTDKYAHKLRFLTALRDYLAAELARLQATDQCCQGLRWLFALAARDGGGADAPRAGVLVQAVCRGAPHNSTLERTVQWQPAYRAAAS